MGLFDAEVPVIGPEEEDEADGQAMYLDRSQWEGTLVSS
jgi:hypothetical protein